MLVRINRFIFSLLTSKPMIHIISLLTTFPFTFDTNDQPFVFGRMTAEDSDLYRLAVKRNTMEGVAEMTINELRETLKSRKLPSSGTRGELEARIATLILKLPKPMPVKVKRFLFARIFVLLLLGGKKFPNAFTAEQRRAADKEACSVSSASHPSGRFRRLRSKRF